MPIRRSNDGLPRATADQGIPPSSAPFIVNQIAERWFERHVENGNLDYAAAIPELPYRASLAGSRCDRQTYYRLTNATETDAKTIADYWRMALGSLVHDGLGAVMESLPSGELTMWQTEVTVDLRPAGIQGSAHADLVRFRCTTTDDPWVPDLVVELKTVNGFKFKSTATRFKGPPQGPDYGHVVQGALAAAGLGVRKVVVAYLSMELVGPDLASYADSEIGRFGAEWRYTDETIDNIVAAERTRIARLLMCVEQDIIPARELNDPTAYPAGAIVYDLPPGKRGKWKLTIGDMTMDMGDAWQCNYCEFRQQCITDGEGTQLEQPTELF